MSKSLPLVAAAVLCERVLVEKDDVVSIVRVIDRVIWEPPPPGVAPELARIQIVCLLILKRGDSTGDEHNFELVLRTPSGKASRPSEGPLVFSLPSRDPDSGVNIQIGLALPTPTEDGLYWVEGHVDGQLIARMPLRLIRREGAAVGGT